LLTKAVTVRPPSISGHFVHFTFFKEESEMENENVINAQETTTLSEGPGQTPEPTPKETAPRIVPTIDPEFQSLIPAQTDEERALLEKQLREIGRCLVPLVVWEGTGILLDGHNRFELCLEHGWLYEIIELRLPSREAAIDWIVEHQLGRRNLLDAAKSYYRGVRYQAAEKRQGRRPSGQRGQNVQKSLSQQLGEADGVHERTIRRDADWANDIDCIADNCGDEFRRAILSGSNRSAAGKDLGSGDALT
jgi:hypothetical protein